MAGAIRILIVDDSALTRETLRRTLELDPRLKVVGEAKTGEESIELVRALSPDLVTMDLQMPGMGGLKAIEVIMRERPTPIVVISERSSAGVVDYNYEAISRGALELVPKSSVFGQGPDDVRRFAERIRRLGEEGLSDDRPAPPREGSGRGEVGGAEIPGRHHASLVARDHRPMDLGARAVHAASRHPCRPAGRRR